jgi:hypothetical protein
VVGGDRQREKPGRHIVTRAQYHKKPVIVGCGTDDDSLQSLDAQFTRLCDIHGLFSSGEEEYLAANQHFREERGSDIPADRGECNLSSKSLSLKIQTLEGDMSGFTFNGSECVDNSG